MIRALAREWAAKRTILSGGARRGEGGACRQAYGTEWARMMVLLQGMQGLGKPGRSIWGTTMGAPSDTKNWFPAYADPQGRVATASIANTLPVNPTKQRVWRLTLPDAILDPPISWYGEGFCGQSIEAVGQEQDSSGKGLAIVALRQLGGGLARLHLSDQGAGRSGESRR